MNKKFIKGRIGLLNVCGSRDRYLVVEEFSRRYFFRNYLITFLNDELYAQTKVFAKKISIFKNSGRGGLKNDDFWHFRE